MAVFTGGVNIGPYEAARHISGVSARELSMVRNRHIDLKKLNSAIATVVKARCPGPYDQVQSSSA
jgi:hypothetical protein